MSDTLRQLNYLHTEKMRIVALFGEEWWLGRELEYAALLAREQACASGRTPWNWAKLPGLRVRGGYFGPLEMVVIYDHAAEDPWLVLRMQPDPAVRPPRLL